jgi:hypothetical protein
MSGAFWRLLLSALHVVLVLAQCLWKSLHRLLQAMWAESQRLLSKCDMLVWKETGNGKVLVCIVCFLLLRAMCVGRKLALAVYV